jgi:hypothetical protein
VFIAWRELGFHDRAQSAFREEIGKKWGEGSNAANFITPLAEARDRILFPRRCMKGKAQNWPVEAALDVTFIDNEINRPCRIEEQASDADTL